MSMDIETKEGSKIKYCNFKNGIESDRDNCDYYLDRDKIYTLHEYARKEASRTEIYLREVPNVPFNSVMFNNVD